ncbi:hypothetical protein Tco_0105533 [Tanacetum coccineum]
MVEETPSTIPVDAFEDGPNRSDPKEPPLDMNISNPTLENHTRDHTPENASENASGTCHAVCGSKLKQINAMYSAFSSKRKEVNLTSIIENDDHPTLEPWQSDSGGLLEEVIQQTPWDATLAVETKSNIRALVASPFTTQIRDYDMLDGLKVPTNLNTYDGTSDPDDHLTIFMGTMDVHKLPGPTWCHFFHITLCGAARFWKVLLRPLSRMFVLAHRKDRTRYCEFHNDHDQDTNDYVDLQKEIEMYVRNGRLSHLARGAKAQNNSQNATPSSIAKKVKDQVDWKQKIVETKAVNEVLITNEKWSPACHESRTSQPSTNIAFLSDDPILEHCNGDNPLIIKAEIRECMIHRIYVDEGSSTEIMYEHCFHQLSDEAKASI